MGIICSNCGLDVVPVAAPDGGLMCCPLCGADVAPRSVAPPVNTAGSVGNSRSLAVPVGPDRRTPSMASPGGRVSSSKRKVCAVCGTDVTFSGRIKDDKGGFLCETCAPPADSMASLESLLPQNDSAPPPPMLAPSLGIPPAPVKRGPLSQTAIGTALGGIAKGESNLDGIAEVVASDLLPRRKSLIRRPTTATWVTALIVVQVLLIGGAAAWFFRPTWEDKNRPTILALQAEAETFAKKGDAKNAYYAYQRLFQHIGTHEVKYLESELATARAGMDRALRTARPIIEREEAEARAREEARRRADEESKRQAEQARRQQLAEAEQLKRERKAAEASRAEQERKLAAEKSRQMKLALVRAEYQRTAEYGAFKAKADSLVRTLSSEMVLEDSAYRGMSKRGRAARDLLAIYIKIHAKLAGLDVTLDVERVIQQADRELALEDSAIRAIYKNDAAFFELLGIWCSVLEKSSEGLTDSFSRERRDVDLKVATDDSAIRLIYYYLGGSLKVLKHIMAATGEEAAAQKVGQSIEVANTGDDSAWRVGMNNAKGVAELLLMILEKRDAKAAQKIRSTTDSDVRFDDSALRSHGSYKQAIVDALHRLISLH